MATERHLENLDWLTWLSLFSIICLACVLRYNLVDVPLERDEGEYAYGGQLLLQGILPYQLLYNMKLPGIYAVYAIIITIFGQSHTGVHLGLIAVNSISIALVFFIGRHIYGSLAGLAAAISFAVLSMGLSVQGVFANSEHFVVLFYLAGTLSLLRIIDRGTLWQYILPGLLFGICFTIKQHGIFFIAWAYCYLFVVLKFSKGIAWKKLLMCIGLFSIGVMVPYLLVCLIFAQAGLFDKFWFWTVDYARAYTSQVPFGAAMENLKWQTTSLFKASPLIWSVAGIGIIYCFKSFRLTKGGFMLSLALFSLGAICPGFFFRAHYFIFVLPAAAFMFGGGINLLSEKFLKEQRLMIGYGLPLFVLFCSIASSLYIQRLELFELTPAQVTSKTYWPNPFNESLEISKYIKENSRDGDRIAVIGSEPQIYFYTGLKSASGYIYMYPLMENHDFALKMQKELIKEVEETGPEYLLFVRNPLSWLQKPGSHTLIYSWFSEYKENYNRVGLIQIFEKSSRFSWAPGIDWPPVSPYWIEVLRKKKS